VSEETTEKKVRVIDRRWMDSDGTPKDPSSVAPPQPSPPSPPAAPDAPPSPPSTGPEPGDPKQDVGGGPSPTGQVNFLDLVDFLAQQAAAFLSGQIPGRGRDLATARFFIDLLGVLKEKTAGRLGREEASNLEDVLYQLRALYLAATR
jgi:hypothetical protein